MAENEIPSLFDIDWIGDLTLYQHPPCMFILWYGALGVTFIWKIVDEFLQGLNEGGDGGEGGEGGESGEGGDSGEGEKEEQPEGEEEEAPAEEPPAEEEEG